MNDTNGFGSEWQLVWSDEFDGDRLDPDKWQLCKRGKADWDNTVSEDPRLVQVRQGSLQLLGIANEHPEQDPAPYLTGAVTSRDKYSFKYGKVEIRARFKSAQGAWPALWMLGAAKKWPHCGEIDLMEHLNFDDIVYQTIHSDYSLNIDTTNTPPKGVTAPIKRDDWNNYGCEWDATQIIFTLNGAPTMTYPQVVAKGAAQWPFDQPFYFILSMQIGGGWVNTTGPTNPAHYPAGMEIDYVRVYQRV